MNDKRKSAGLDDFTRKYVYVLIGLALAGVVWWVSTLDFRAGEINKMLEADARLAAYPYPFRVIALENGVAQMSSPRSAQMSVIQSLRVMYPELQESSPASDEMMAAQVKLARTQSYAGERVQSEEDVKSVRWVLDKNWLAKNGVNVDQL